MAVLIALVVAVFANIVATVFYIAIVWRLDRYEKEPFGMLAAAFIWGMIPAIILSIMLELGMDGAGGEAASDLVAQAGVAPIVEESVKGLALLLFMIFAYRELDNVLDGIIYGAMIGFGFAFTENILYVVGASAEKGLGVALFVLFLRTVIFGANHAFFSAVMGAGVGAARLTRGLLPRVALLAFAWMLAVFFHAVHNLGAALTESTSLLSLGVSFLVDWGGIFGMLVLVGLVWRKEKQWIVQHLSDEVVLGVLTPEEFVIASNLSLRQRTLAAALRHDGRAAYRRMARLYTLLTELAWKKQQLHTMGDEGGNAAIIERLRADIARLRSPQTPA